MALSSSNKEDGGDQFAILAQLAALDQAQGFSLGGLPPESIHCANGMAFSFHLGLSYWACMEWMDHYGMLWPTLLHLLLQVYRGSMLHVLLVYLGYNNLGLFSVVS